MYQISELAQRVGLSRTTLLYYERLGLLKGRRQANGYRVYTDADRQRLLLLQQLQAGGLSLQECQTCMDGKLDRDMLGRRLRRLEDEIAAKQDSRDLLAALLGRSSLKNWHEKLERVAPDLHRAWLMRQGFTSEEAARVAWLSKDMNEHDAYMADFMEVFSELEWWGPGSEEATRRALSKVPIDPDTILEIGCGKGLATMTLAAATNAHITASDTADDALDQLRAKVNDASLQNRVDVRNLDMAQVPVPDQPWDLIWTEGSIYIIGVDRALESWRPLLRPQGVLVFSDMVWRTDAPSEEAREFWMSEYPTMASVSERLEQIARAGYKVIDHFDMGQGAMDNYYVPLQARVQACEHKLPDSRAIADLKTELRIRHENSGQFSYEMFIVERP